MLYHIQIRLLIKKRIKSTLTDSCTILIFHERNLAIKWLEKNNFFKCTKPSLEVWYNEKDTEMRVNSEVMRMRDSPDPFIATIHEEDEIQGDEDQFHHPSVSFTS